MFAIEESIARISDLFLVKEIPEVFPKNSIHLHYLNSWYLIFVHSVLGILFLLAGSYQLIPYFRNLYPNIHRFVGKIFLLAAILLAVTSILLAILNPFGNYIETAVTLVFGIYIIIGSFIAYRLAKEKKIIKHSYWVRRVFFIALSIASIRLFIGFNILIFNSTVKEAMGISFLEGFLLHFLLIELWIYLNRRQNRLSQVH
ncbi:DUF2306 domain-containing protein [Christiangramia salexigens]|uniref:DUF2306 domain-containing protein n=1 Tax=Christiangramia salexigens TaxID=1913577 RepID=UPI0018DD86A7|nr:DUF2306 domain-containing protein [Christiangramia salexigens]